MAIIFNTLYTFIIRKYITPFFSSLPNYHSNLLSPSRIFFGRLIQLCRLREFFLNDDSFSNDDENARYQI